MEFLMKAIADLESLQGKLVTAVCDKQIDVKSSREIDEAIQALRLKLLEVASRMD